MKGYNAFILISSFFVLGVFAINYIVFAFKKNVVDAAVPEGMLSSTSVFSFPTVWQTTSYFGGMMLLLPGLLLLILITNEFGFRTHRQNIIDGISRKDFIRTKLMLGAIFALISTFVIILAALIFGFLNEGSFSLSGFENVGYFFLKALTYNFIAVLISVLVRRTGFAIAVYFIYTVLENGVSFILYTWAIKLKKESHLDLGDLGNYLPMNAADGLLYSPFNSITKMGNQIFPTDILWLVLVLSIVYIAIFYFFSERRMVKSDL